MIKNWNSVVTNQDCIVVVGDMFFYDCDSQKRIMNKLNGYKILVLGNHDKKRGTREDLMTLKDYFDVGWAEVIHEFQVINVMGMPLGIAHDPALCNLDMSINWVCGHIHNVFRRTQNVLNVGVDVNNFTPISDAQVKHEFYYEDFKEPQWK